MRRAGSIHDAWETLRILNIGGQYYAFQQKQELWKKDRSGARDGGTSIARMPANEHRMVPLHELVDMQEIVDETMGGQPVDSMEEI